jgi:hypothetical protein
MGVIFFSQGFLTDDSLHGSSVLGGCVVSIKLVGNWSVVFSVFFNGFLHQSGQRWQDVDWWVNLFIVQLSIDEDLSFCDVASQIGNWMGDIIVLK